MRPAIEREPIKVPRKIHRRTHEKAALSEHKYL
jgi:hypothetical protein